MELFDEGIKLTKEDISKYEKKMNTKFPEAYVNFLLESNGETPEEDLAFDFIDIASNKKNSTDIREFYIFYPVRILSCIRKQSASASLHKLQSLHHNAFSQCICESDLLPGLHCVLP